MQDTPAQNDRLLPDVKQMAHELIAEAEAVGINVTGEIEAALRAAIAREKRIILWREENHAAIEASNQEFERNGPWCTPDWLEQ